MLTGCSMNPRRSRVPAVVALSALAAAAVAPGAAARQPTMEPETLIVKSGSLQLRALLFRPRGNGPFPAVLFNHGSYLSSSPMSRDEPAIAGNVFTKHGYALLFLFRQGIGLSVGQGTADGDLMENALKTGGPEARNRVQLELLEGDELNEVTAGLAALRSRPGIDSQRVAVVGHSFGGQLSLVQAERDARVRAAVLFGPAAASWERSPILRTRLLDAARLAHAPMMIIHARNDYSVAPGEAMAAEMKRARERDVFAFLDPLMRP